MECNDSLLHDKLVATAKLALLLAETDCAPTQEGSGKVEAWTRDIEDMGKTNDTMFKEAEMPSASDRQTLVDSVTAALAAKPEAVLRVFDTVRGRLKLPGGTNRGRLERGTLGQLHGFRDFRDFLKVCCSI